MQSVRIQIILATTLLVGNWAHAEMPVVPDGMIGHWTFDDHCRDSCGLHHGQMFGCRLVPEAKVGSHCVEFGSRDEDRSVVLGDFDPSAGDLTIAMWICPHRDGNGHQVLMAKREAWKQDSLRWQFVWQDIHPPKKPIPGEPYALTKEVLRFESWPDSRAEFPCKLPPGKWTHLALVYRGNDGITKLYINGTEVDVPPQTMKFGPARDAPVVIGGPHPDDWREIFHGRIDDVCFWDRALTPEEIRVVWNPAEQPSDGSREDASHESTESANESTIDIWYGDQQCFGHLGGHPQRWINILGNARPADSVKSISYCLNGGEPRLLSFKEDKKRIARDGDFNVEIARSDLLPAKNTVVIGVTTHAGEVIRKTVTVCYTETGREWPLPYTVDWSKVDRIENAVQIIDGKWKRTESGLRSVEPYYDRAFALGDTSWQNYEVTTTLTVHALTPPHTGSNNTDVTHAAIALRWPGHDPDGAQPTVKWHPLGATGEFRLGGDLMQCRWRIFDGRREFHRESERRRELKFETPYAMKHRVETMPDGSARYRAKLWPADKDEPLQWDFERIEPVEDVPYGSALLLAHHSDVTFGNIHVTPIPKPGN